MQHESSYIDKAVEGMLMTFFNQGEVCTCPSRALVQASIYDDFMDKVLARARTIVQGNPLDTATQVGAQASREQFDKILSYMEIGRGEGAKMLIGGGPARVSGLEEASTSSPPSSRVRTRCGCSRRRSSGQRSGSPPSRTRRRRWRLPTTPSTGWGGPVDPRQQPGLAHGARHPGRPGLGQLLPRLPGARGLGGYKKSGSAARPTR